MKLTEEQKAAIRHREAHDCSLIMLPWPEWWNNKEKTPEQQQEIKDRAQTLQAGLRMDYGDKLRHTRKIIEKALEQDATWALSYSAGGDSTVLSHIMVEGMGLKTPHVMSNTRMEYPETNTNKNRRYATLRALGVPCDTAYPDVRPKDLWKEIGVPLWSKQIAYKYRKFFNSPNDVMSKAVPENLRSVFRKLKAAGIKVTDECCKKLKKDPMKKWDKANGITGHFTGVRCGESRDRRLGWIINGSLYFAKTHRIWISNPLAFWTADDIKTYMAVNQIEYIRPNNRRGGSGCTTCMFGCHIQQREGQLNTLQELATTNPRMYQTALDDWGYREALEVAGIPFEITEEDCF